MRRLGCLAKLVVTLMLCAVGVGAVIALVNPWALHMGGRRTLLLTWHGSGNLHTKAGADYPLYVSFYPSFHFSQLHLDGRRASGGLSGYGCFCTSPVQYFGLSGTIYGSWQSTEGSILSVNLVERRTARETFAGNLKLGYFHLIGTWRGQDLILDERGAWSRGFRSGLRIVDASVALHPDDYWTCKAACAASHGNS